jgi:hypothetical protein
MVSLLTTPRLCSDPIRDSEIGSRTIWETCAGMRVSLVAYSPNWRPHIVWSLAHWEPDRNDGVELGPAGASI